MFEHLLLYYLITLHHTFTPYVCLAGPAQQYVRFVSTH